jgi:hypothetical protein
MKYKFLALALITLQCIGCTQKIEKQTVQGEWIIKEGWFGKDLISLERLDLKKHKTLATLLVFEEKNQLTPKFYDPQKSGACKVGMPYFDTATWKLNNTEIDFDIKGGRVGVNTFAYKISYNVISISKDKISLRKQGKSLVEEKKYFEM